MHPKHSLAFSACLLFGGCSPFVPIVNPETVEPTVAATASSIRVIDSEATKGLQPLGEVVGYSCQFLLWDPAATPEAATEQIKLKAAERGATAIGRPDCTAGGFSLGKNCWNSFTCKATAYR